MNLHTNLDLTGESSEWGQKAPQNVQMGAESAPKTTKWGQKAPPLLNQVELQPPYQ